MPPDFLVSHVFPPYVICHEILTRSQAKGATQSCTFSFQTYELNKPLFPTKYIDLSRSPTGREKRRGGSLKQPSAFLSMRHGAQGLTPLPACVCGRHRPTSWFWNNRVFVTRAHTHEGSSLGILLQGSPRGGAGTPPGSSQEQFHCHHFPSRHDCRPFQRKPKVAASRLPGPVPEQPRGGLIPLSQRPLQRAKQNSRESERRFPELRPPATLACLQVPRRRLPASVLFHNCTPATQQAAPWALQAAGSKRPMQLPMGLVMTSGTKALLLPSPSLLHSPR